MPAPRLSPTTSTGCSPSTSALPPDTTTSRSNTFGANGDVLLNGNLLNSGAFDAIWNKTGVGTLAITGTASTGVGTFNITNGTVAVNAMGALNAALSGGAQLGLTTNNGVLNYFGGSGTGTGETSAKAIILSGTTGGGAIFANQQQSAANTAPTALVLSSSVAATGVAPRRFPWKDITTVAPRRSSTRSAASSRITRPPALPRC